MPPSDSSPQTPVSVTAESPVVYGGETARTRGPDRRTPDPDLISGRMGLTRLAAIVCLGLSVFQVYVANFGVINLSVFWLTCLVALPLAINGPARHFTLMQAAIGLLAVQLYSLTWSPAPLIGVYDIMGLLAFMVMLALGLKLGGKDWHGLIALLRLYCLIAVVQSALVIALRIDSHTGFALTEAFLRGDIARLFIEPNILSLFLGGDGWGIDVNPHQVNTMGGIYNVFGPEKAGGFELNGNIAGAWGGMLTFLSLGLFDKQRPVRSGLIVLVHAASVIASGSKASLLLLGLAPLIVAALRFAPKLGHRVKPWQAITGGLLLAGIATAVVARDQLLPLIGGRGGYAQAALTASHCRAVLLSHAQQALSPDWLAGHGYGGWVKTYDRPEAIKDLCLIYKLPPHNAFILLWTQSGIAALAFGIVFIGLGLKNIADLLQSRRAQFALGALAACLFVVFQAMGENISLFTSLHLTAPMAFIMGGCAAQARALKDEAHAKAMGDRRDRERRTGERRSRRRGNDERRDG